MVHPSVAVVIPGFNRVTLLRRAIESVAVNDYDDLTICYVDGGSTDGSPEFAKTIPRVRVVHSPLNTPSANRNLGVRCSEGEVIHFLDDDAFVPPDFYRQATLPFSDPHIGIVASPVVSSDDFKTVQFSGVRLMEPLFIPIPERDNLVPSHVRNTFQALECSFLIRREVFDRISGFDESLFKYGAEGFDLCWRAWMTGVRVVVAPPTVYHKGIASNIEVSSKDQIRGNISDIVANYMLIYVANSSFSTRFQFPIVFAWLATYPARSGQLEATVPTLKKFWSGLFDSRNRKRRAARVRSIRSRSDLQIVRDSNVGAHDSA